MGILLADQPHLGIPGPAAPPASQALNMTFFTNILVTKCAEFFLRPYSNSEIIAFTFRSWFCSFSSFRLGRRVFLRCLRSTFLRVFLRKFFLFFSGHLICSFCSSCTLRILLMRKVRFNSLR